MYLPDVFQVTDRAELFAHITAYPFATLITQGGEGPEASHVPLLVDAERGVLLGHVARENPQLSHLASGAAALAVFHGPHGYVSPSVYGEPSRSVPTWNFVVVHARGRPRLVDEHGLREILDATVARFDETGWRLSEDDPELLARMLGAIAGFEIAIESLQGKWKISQNRPASDVPNVIRWLEKGDDASRAIAALMRARARARPPSAT